jgi:hypothetical protein
MKSCSSSGSTPFARPLPCFAFALGAAAASGGSRRAERARESRLQGRFGFATIVGHFGGEPLFAHNDLSRLGALLRWRRPADRERRAARAGDLGVLVTAALDRSGLG